MVVVVTWVLGRPQFKQPPGDDHGWDPEPGERRFKRGQVSKEGNDFS